MKEHIFRGKRVDNNEWVRGSYVRAHKYLGGATGHFIYDIYGERRVLVVPDTVSEFTGLRDKNGESIFEGDIVRVTTPQGRVADVLVQNGEYFDGEELYIGVYGTIDGRSAAMLAGKDEHYEVIGNKWDNPELLEGGAA